MGSILAIGCQSGQYKINQQEIGEKITTLCTLSEERSKRLQKMYTNCRIFSRYSVLDEFSKDITNWNLFTKTTSERNELYKLEAPKLSLLAAKKALDSWGGSPELLTHIIFVSCTGVIAPGIQVFLQQTLGLRDTVNQLAINMMGCFGAFKGLDVANAYAKNNPKNRILLICTELCSLHFQKQDSDELQIANLLFSDGAAACIIGANLEQNEKPLWKIEAHCSKNIANSMDQMSWQVSDSGFIMGLKENVASHLAEHCPYMLKELLGDTIEPAMCDWPIHPGGKNILIAFEKALGLKNKLKHSWHVLENYGNMSSASFLFVLNELSKEAVKKPWAVGFGFGPGLTFEGILLSR